MYLIIHKVYLILPKLATLTLPRETHTKTQTRTHVHVRTDSSIYTSIRGSAGAGQWFSPQPRQRAPQDQRREACTHLC